MSFVDILADMTKQGCLRRPDPRLVAAIKAMQLAQGEIKDELRQK